MTDLEKQAKTLRREGLTYQAICEVLEIPRGKAWILCNRARHNQNSRESIARYHARGCIPLYAIKETSK